MGNYRGIECLHDESCDYDFAIKDINTRRHVLYMLARTQSMFEYTNLPESIPQRNLELMLQTHGHVCISRENDTLYAFSGGMGGEPNVYYMPTIYTVANPALKISRNYVIDSDCIVIPSDSMYMGLLPIFYHYATAMTENELSLHRASIMSRFISLISATDENTKSSAEHLFADIEAGKLGVVYDDALIDSIKSQPIAASSVNGRLTDLIEYEQYLKASWYNELGLNANYNMKRESLNSAESQLNNDALLPLIDDMLRSRRQAIEKVNTMFGTTISVEFSSAWKENEVSTGENPDISSDSE